MESLLRRSTSGSRATGFLILLALAVLGCAPGCAVSKAMQQPGKKNLGVLSEGVPRTHVIAELGKPAWSEEKDGVTTDVFAFKQGYSKPVKVGRATLHAAGDLLTFGLWEVVGIPTEMLADGTDVKVQVDYDEQSAVRSVQVIEGQSAMEPKKPFSLTRRKKSATGARLAQSSDQKAT